MWSIILLFTTLLAGFAAAQNSTSSLDPNSVDPTTRNQWCTSEMNNCPILCGGQAFTKDNKCQGTDLTYTCICYNGSGPSNIAQYLNTLPNNICQQEFANCRQSHPGSQACTTCGTLQPSSVPQSTGMPGASAVATSSSTTTSATASPSAMMKSSAGKVEGAMGGVAAGVLAAFVL